MKRTWWMSIHTYVNIYTYIYIYSVKYFAFFTKAWTDEASVNKAKYFTKKMFLKLFFLYPTHL